MEILLLFSIAKIKCIYVSCMCYSSSGLETCEEPRERHEQDGPRLHGSYALRIEDIGTMVITLVMLMEKFKALWQSLIRGPKETRRRGVPRSFSSISSVLFFHHGILHLASMSSPSSTTHALISEIRELHRGPDFALWQISSCLLYLNPRVKLTPFNR